MSRSRRAAIPNASSPQLLERLLETVAQGVRSPRALHEVLGVDVRTVHYYTQAAEWLSLLDTSGEPCLTALGLELVYADRERAAVYTRAVWATPFVTRLMQLHGPGLPSVEQVAELVAEAEPELARSTVTRRASSVRSLIAPAVGQASRRLSSAQRQLALPLAMNAPTTQSPRLDGTSAEEFNPDIYRFLLRELLSYGELSLTQVRALLDHAHVSAAPIGGYIDLALKRGDAVRLGERVVATRAAIAQRHLVETTTSIVLSDPGYRAYLNLIATAAPTPQDRVRVEQERRRFRAWDLRLFGHPPTPESLDRDLDTLLMDRTLQNFPVRGSTGEPTVPIEAPFLDVWTQPGLAIALPPTLAHLQGGVAAVNRSLKQARHGGATVAQPRLGDRPTLFHGGLLHPGEPMPRSVPDTRSLRHRLLMHTPYVTLISALAWLHRQSPNRLAIVRQRSGWVVRRKRHPMGPLFLVLDTFAASRGWLACRPPVSALGPGELLAALEAVGILSVVGSTAVLAEPFFTQLRSDPEELEVSAALQPLAAALGDWLAQAEPLEDP